MSDNLKGEDIINSGYMVINGIKIPVSDNKPLKQSSSKSEVEKVELVVFDENEEELQEPDDVPTAFGIHHHYANGDSTKIELPEDFHFNSEAKLPLVEKLNDKFYSSNLEQTEEELQKELLKLEEQKKLIQKKLREKKFSTWVEPVLESISKLYELEDEGYKGLILFSTQDGGSIEPYFLNEDSIFINGDGSKILDIKSNEFHQKDISSQELDYFTQEVEFNDSNFDVKEKIEIPKDGELLDFN